MNPAMKLITLVSLLLLAAKANCMAAPTQNPFSINSFYNASETARVLELLRQEFESIRVTITRIETRSDASREAELVAEAFTQTPNHSRGPSTNIREWLSTVTSLARQLPFVQQLFERISTQVTTVNEELGLRRILGMGGDILSSELEDTRNLIANWLRSANSLVNTYEAFNGRIRRARLPRQFITDEEQPNPEISKQEDIDISTIGTLISRVMETTSALRKTVGNSLNRIAAATVRVVRPSKREAEAEEEVSFNAPAKRKKIQSVQEERDFGHGLADEEDEEDANSSRNEDSEEETTTSRPRRRRIRVKPSTVAAPTTRTIQSTTTAVPRPTTIPTTAPATRAEANRPSSEQNQVFRTFQNGLESVRGQLSTLANIVSTFISNYVSRVTNMRETTVSRSGLEQAEASRLVTIIAQIRSQINDLANRVSG